MSESLTTTSAVYSGWVRHRRFAPLSHEFKYPLFMLAIDLDEVEGLFNSKWYCSLEKLNVVSFRRKDYFQPETPDLKQAVLKRVCSELTLNELPTCELPTFELPTRVVMLTQPRYFNITFNPVTFYYCYDSQDRLLAILAEITNTPWGERHAYVLPVGKSSTTVSYARKGKDKNRFTFRKAFHVSPYNPMNMEYDWIFSDLEKQLHVHMDCLMKPSSAEKADKHFDATLVLERKSFQDKFASTLIRMPLMTVKVVWGIYWQAAKLWFKKAPFYDHPDTIDKASAER